MSNKVKSKQDVLQRRRGRPSGKNRTPLSLEERRARNALYERERRNETAEAFLHLAEAAGCDRNISNADLLATVVSQIQRASEINSSHNIDDMKRINENLESQILTLQGRLGHDGTSLELLDNETENHYDATNQEYNSDDNIYYNHHATEKHAKKRNRRSNSSQQRKRRKFNSVWSDDSGIESQSPQPESVPSVQYITETQTLDIQHPEDIQEPIATQAQIDLNSELYHQLYPDPVEGESRVWNDGAQNPTPYYMESLAQSLITIPPITPPQQVVLMESYKRNIELPNVMDQLDMEPFAAELMPLFDRELIEQMPLLEIEQQQSLRSDSDTVHEVQPNLDLLTDNEKGMITEWILNGDFLENYNESQPSAYTMNYTPGYS